MALKTTEVEAKGGRSRHRSLGLSDEQALRIYEVMRLARAVDERMWLINRQGRAPFVISCQGQEGAQVGTAAALRQGYDWVAPYYRDAGVVLWFGMTARDQMLSFFARREDPNSAGRQMPGHFGSFRLHIVTGGSPVATQLLHAAGVALASQQRKEDAGTGGHPPPGRHPRGDELRRHPQAGRGLCLREQRLRHLSAAVGPDGDRQRRGSRRRVRAPGP